MVQYKAREVKIGDMEIKLDNSAFLPATSTKETELTPDDYRKLEEEILYYSSK